MDTNQNYEDAISESGIRRGDERSLAAFIRVFDPVVRKQARLHGVDVGDVDTVITEFLDDMLIELMNGASFPAKLGGYVTSAFRHHVIRLDKSLKQRAERLDLVAHELSVIGTSSSSAAITHLCEIAERGLSDADRQLVVYVSSRTPPRDVARYLNIERSAAKVRIHRLRQRLHTLMLAAVDELPAKERREVEQILRRGAATAGSPMQERKIRGTTRQGAQQEEHR